MVQDSPSRKMDQFIVRLPDGMRDRIKAAAETNNRSMNAEIVAALEAAYPAPPTENFAIWLSLEKERIKTVLEADELWHLAQDAKDSPDYFDMTQRVFQIHKKIDALRDRQAEILDPEMVALLERLYKAGTLEKLIEQASPIID
ncbi:Arc family DNA-binding protein [Paracoccus sp. TOH]|uniref:Arc family DNA-binding protein n=1 Tax=Paracoccus sp. TOH TaxID=1263728 RepID=UPI0025B1B2F7|nr:Arc family DNA-binding protein [Paracoccus sp. TOH]WJS83534.1 Arc family DNA-binding protein [Paracoccus sp. TOH]